MNFHNADWRAMWRELASVIEFWCEHGVRIFRVDNPHTKPVTFWEYLIARVQRRWPDAVFLSEAFTKPKMMRALAKRASRRATPTSPGGIRSSGLTEYFTELTQARSSPTSMRPNLFPNTPDILPSYLQFGGRPAFIVRAVLASHALPDLRHLLGFRALRKRGAVEVGHGIPRRDVRHFLNLCDWDYKQLAKEEYLRQRRNISSKSRDWNAPGNIKGSHHAPEPRAP